LEIKDAPPVSYYLGLRFNLPASLEANVDWVLGDGGLETDRWFFRSFFRKDKVR